MPQRYSTSRVDNPCRNANGATALKPNPVASCRAPVRVRE
jgi:hypothetical protein